MTDDPRKAAYRARKIREHCKKTVLALIATYYPPFLREKILACCRAHLARNYRRACRSYLCPACNSQESKRIFEAQYARFELCTPPGKPVRIAHEVYTLPPHLRSEIVTPEGFAAWKRATLNTVRYAHKDQPIGGIMNLHPIGDQDFTEFHPHWDVVINGYTLADGTVRQNRPGRPDFNKIRAYYIEQLTRELKLRPEAVPRAASIHIRVKGGRFATAKGATRHIIRYSARHVYLPHRAWLNDHGTKGDWWYKPREGQRDVQVREGKDAIIALLSHDAKLENRKRRVWFGYMQNRLTQRAKDAFGRAGDLGATLESEPTTSEPVEPSPRQDEEGSE